MTADTPDKTPGRGLELGDLQRTIEEDHRRLRLLEERVSNPEVQTRAVSRVLPQAIAIRSRQDHALSDALEPTVESALRAAVRDDPKLVADAIYPIIGPAIRKSIFNALSTMVQRVNRAREESLTFHGLAWRWEAIRTGRPFAEVVLMKSLVFRVEQVFLIHRETGLLLQHVVAPGVAVKDAQMVSGMLSAIQDFVRDSFPTGGGETLQLLRVGEVTIAVEQGPLAIVSVVVRGVPPVDLRAPLQGVVEKIHAETGDELASFQGDTAPFVVVRSLLEACLIERRREPRTGFSISMVVSVLVLIGAALFGLRYLVVLGIVRGERNRLVEVLEREPGYALLSTRIDLVDRILHVHAMRDPLARNALAVLKQVDVDPQDVVLHWSLYESLDPELLLERARIILETPASVTLSLDDGVMHARGSAPHRWIARAAAISVAMPGIRAFDSKELADPEAEEVLRLKHEIEESRVTFEKASAATIDEASFAQLRERVLSIDDAARKAGFLIHIRVFASVAQGAKEAPGLTRARAVCSALESLALGEVRCSAGVRRNGGKADESSVGFTVDLLEAASLPEDKR